MWRAGALAQAGRVIPDETIPTAPDPAEERALRRDLVLLAASRRLRRRARRRAAV